MDADGADLLAEALKVRAKAHAPYSQFKVGAALRGARGGLFAAANVENAAYPLGTCAEAGAIAALVAGGETRIAAVLVAGFADGRPDHLATPCGGCRQRLAEFAGPDTKVHIAGPQGVRATYTLGELLPHAFGLPQTAPA